MKLIVIEPIRTATAKDEIPIRKSNLKSTTTITFEDVKFTSQELVGINAKHNRIKCGKCGKILESIYDHHSVFCSCGNCKIDGGSRELIRDCKGPFVELSEFY